MGADWVTETIHAAPVEGGAIITKDKRKIDVKQLRAAIPAHCLEPSTFWSSFFLLRDLACYGALLGAALFLEPRVLSRPWASLALRFVVFPYLAGVALTGVWVIGHEAGHGAFSKNKTLANLAGFLCHSSLMSPYFSWRSSHARHHQYANNVSIDLNYVPPQREEYQTMFQLGTGGGSVGVGGGGGGGGGGAWDEMLEDAPVAVFLRIVFQQLIGFPWYLLTHITAGPNSSPKPSRGWWDNSHFMPNSSLFRADEFWDIVLSDVGVLGMSAILYALTQRFGFETILWTYGLPLVWVNHWIVMITYLHHTAPYLPKFQPESWTYLRGALATVDRDPGWFMRHMTHHIIDRHVVHHLFPRIPHYRSVEATAAIRPLLGDYYFEDKTSYWGALWTAFTKCQWVEPDVSKTREAKVYSNRGDDAETTGAVSKTDEKGILWYVSGRMPPPVVKMRS
ncbi:fatty acid desaturase-domain-containing protein [Xylariomycetidae sp. FL2044]|nr:fatty acid desaturase-domain-containing protein [Xylariomycetidae sp. FL2044]